MMAFLYQRSLIIGRRPLNAAKRREITGSSSATRKRAAADGLATRMERASRRSCSVWRRSLFRSGRAERPLAAPQRRRRRLVDLQRYRIEHHAIALARRREAHIAVLHVAPDGLGVAFERRAAAGAAAARHAQHGARTEP